MNNLELKYSRELVACFDTLLKNAEVFKHTDILTGGIPDMSATWGGFTTWLEVKVDRGKGIEGRGIQHETACRLERLGSCWYVVYTKQPGHPQMTRIVKPSFVSLHGYIHSHEFNGIAHSAVVQFIRDLHSSRLRRRNPEEVEP